MKYVIFLCDGMGDYRLPQLGERTPIEAARKPNMDKIAATGATGLVQTIPDGMTPGSDIASLSILGYDPRQHYNGRGPLEALNLGIQPAPDEHVFRCNLVSVGDRVMEDYSGGHISSEEGAVLIDLLNNKLAEEGVKFYAGTSYRNIVTINDQLLTQDKGELKCTPPHDITGCPIEKHLPIGKGSEKLKQLMFKSREILAESEVNRVRIDLSENPANMIWIWGGGKLKPVPSFHDKFTHTSEPVPMAVAGAGVTADGVEKFDEFSVKKGKLGTLPGHELMELLISEEI